MITMESTGEESALEERASPWIAFTRVFAGLLVLYEVVAGGWWKVGTPSTGTNPEWFGAEAGSAITRVAERAIDEGVYGWYAAVLESVVLPYATEWATLAAVGQLLIALGLIVGLWTRPAAIFGLLYFLPVFHFGTIRTSPLFAVPIAFALVANAGYHYGLDGWLRERGSRGARLSDRVASLGGLTIPRRAYPGLAAASAVVAVYYLLSISQFESGRLALVGLELTVFFAILAGWFALAARGKETVALAADGLRIFVGYRFLQEIFVRSDPGLNALPGWASAGDQAAVFEAVAATHLGPVSLLLESVVLPAIGAWVVAFALVQTACGVALLVGYRTRLFGTVAVSYLLVLVALGFVRLAPLVLASAVAAAALGGRYASLDAVAGRREGPPAVPARLAPAFVGVTVGFGTLGIALGVEPGGYGETTGAITLVMLAMLAAAAAVAARAGDSSEPARGRPSGNEAVSD
ncbi:DoxX family membrane protein [Natronobiforma cellulositropha]|uniref:DoxX family membrane protein n=1 Tax=Natronobiforma cellulositropha TaxID=1679076 RepID=UPI0021D5ECED|nr:DoxX family membrane protein [Natronobiforma cellulositropha]